MTDSKNLEKLFQIWIVRLQTSAFGWDALSFTTDLILDAKSSSGWRGNELAAYLSQQPKYQDPLCCCHAKHCNFGKGRQATVG